MLELMHFPDELIDASEFKAPTLKSVGKSEMRMALQLVESMSPGGSPKSTPMTIAGSQGLDREKDRTWR